MELAEAVRLITRAIETESVAHGYLVCGDVKGNCLEFTDAVLGALYPAEPEKIAARIHPDVAWLEPVGRSRTIKTEDMRERIVAPMCVTSFSGGWKVGVIVGADRTQIPAANVFLKTLEEPPPKTLFLLLTDRPDAILPTIVSRTQRVNLPMPSGILDDEFGDRIRALLVPNGNGVWEKSLVGAELASILGELKDCSEDEDVPIVRKRFYLTVMSRVRDWMVGEKVPRHQAFRNVEAVEDAYRQSERAIPDEAVLCHLTERLVFPQAREEAR